MKSRKRSDTVPFEQGRAYYSRRAGVNLRQGRFFDSLRLTNKALKEAPQDGLLWLDGANALSPLGFVEKSSEYITRAMLCGAPADRVGLAVYMNLIRRHLYNEANTLACFLKPEQVAEGMRFEQEYNSEPVFVPGREARVLKLLTKAVMRYSESGDEREFNLFRRHRIDTPYINAQYATLLAGTKRKEGAKPFALKAERQLMAMKIKPYPVMSACVRALALSGEMTRAQKLSAAMTFDLVPRLMRLDYIQTLSFTGEHARIYDFCASLIKSEEHDITILHALSVAAAMLNMEESKVLSGWQRILEFDENNLICHEFMRDYRLGELKGNAQDYTFEMHPRLALRLNKRLQALPGNLKEIKNTDIDLNQLLYFSGDPRLQEAGMWLRIMSEGEECKREMALLALRADLPRGARKTAREFAGASGEDALYKLLDIEYPLNLMQTLLSSPLWVRQIHNDVCSLLRDRGETEVIFKMTEMLLKAFDDPHVRREMFNDVDAACAALWCLSRKRVRDAKYKLDARIEYRISSDRLDNMLRLIQGKEKRG